MFCNSKPYFLLIKTLLLHQKLLKKSCAGSHNRTHISISMNKLIKKMNEIMSKTRAHIRIPLKPLTFSRLES